MFFPILGAHISRSEFQSPGLISKVLCGIMANLVAESGYNKGHNNPALFNNNPRCFGDKGGLLKRWFLFTLD